ncbi:MAG: DUF4440 domain-containing protein [Saprospiraceae bacterium]
MKKVFFFLLMVTLTTSTFAQTKVNQNKEVKKLMEASRAWAKSSSPEMFMSFIDKDAIMMAPDKAIAKGHPEIGKLLGEFQSYPGFQIVWEPQEAHVSSSGDLGYTVDRILVNFTGEDGKKIDVFEKGVTVWKKDAKGDWKLAVDIWNIDPTIKSIY